jgi:hypothetical protein
MGVLDLDTSPRGQPLMRLLIDVMTEASAMVMPMVMMCESAPDVGPSIDPTIECLGRLTS